ncbi:MAG: 6-carboxytetrahydropterin synthase [Bacteroidales bacterium]|nr:6-carboxytetrahydropterin synthase [Bacteroidales bacterium]
MILRLTKEFNFEMAHALTGYDGKCRNLHGHSYRLFVTIEGSPIADETSPKQGMVIDFGDLKHIVNETIMEPFDHALVLSQNSPYNKGFDTKTVLVPFQPTCENLLIHFAGLLADKVPKGVKIHSLKLYETATSYAVLIL